MAQGFRRSGFDSSFSSDSSLSVRGARPLWVGHAGSTAIRMCGGLGLCLLFITMHSSCVIGYSVRYTFRPVLSLTQIKW